MSHLGAHEGGWERWRALYAAAGAAALLSALFIPLQIVILLANPFPADVVAWFDLIQRNRLIGLINLDLLIAADLVLLVPIYAALYVTLRQTNESVVLIATAAVLVAIVVSVGANPALQMASLSDHYARTVGDRSLDLAAGQAILATWQGTATYTGYFLAFLGGVMVALVMLRSGLFGPVAAWAGIFANALGLGIFVPTYGPLLAAASFLPLEIWYVAIARGFFQLRQIPAIDAPLRVSQTRERTKDGLSPRAAGGHLLVSPIDRRQA